tara:strand:+ start:1605 stop:1847 length:243 start_codon:yes stop_codon:yes gene_type:complete
MKKLTQTLQNLVLKYVEHHYIFTITTDCNTGFTVPYVEYQLREINDEHFKNHKYVCHISTRDENEFYKEVVEYILEKGNL